MSNDSARTQRDDPGITLTQVLPARLTDGEATVVPAAASPRARSGAAATGRSDVRPRYAIVGHAGSGGMAVVHVAQDLELLRRVALKQLTGESDSSGAEIEAARLRFLREVQITAQLDHPHIIPVYGLEVAPDGAPAYAMKYIEGVTLGDLIDAARSAAEQQRREPRSALLMRLEHFLKVCDAVDYAHDKGVIHRDLKPANVMIGPHHEIYVMDWGICRLFGQNEPERAPRALSQDTDGTQTEYGTVIGTPRYMSPEQAQGRSEALGPQSDQCALGLILFELVCLRAPFAGSNVHAVLEEAAHGRRLPISDPHLRRVPAPLRAVIDRATAYQPEQRYASVRALADDLRRYLRGEAVLAMPDSLWQKALRYVGRHRQQMLIGILGVVAVGALSVILLLQTHERELAAARVRDAQIRSVVEQVARKGDELQLRLLRLEGEVDALAAAAAQLLLHGTQSTQTVLWSEDYLDSLTQPADFGPHPGFAQPVSLSNGVWTQAPEVQRSAVLAQAQRLVNIVDYRNKLFADARATLGGGDGRAGISRLVIALESGLSMRYPGRVDPPNAADPRTKPWYLAAKANRHAIWGGPFVSAESGEVLLPLAEALHDADGTPIGVLWIDISLEHVIRNLLDETDGADTTQLLDAAGNVLASQRLLREATRDAVTPDDALPLRPFPDPALLLAAQHADVGAVESAAFGEPEVIAFDRIQPMGWILVSKRASSQLFSPPSQ